MKALLKRRLDALQEINRNEECLSDLLEINFQLSYEIDKEEAFWEQRAWINWLKLDNFFHKFASQRRKINEIKNLERSDSKLIGDLEGMEDITQSFFKDLFTTKWGSTDLNHILSSTDRCISKEDNSRLMAVYTIEEIWEALKSMSPTKHQVWMVFQQSFFKNVDTL